MTRSKPKCRLSDKINLAQFGMFAASAGNGYYVESRLEELSWGSHACKHTVYTITGPTFDQFDQFDQDRFSSSAFELGKTCLRNPSALTNKGNFSYTVTTHLSNAP